MKVTHAAGASATTTAVITVVAAVRTTTSQLKPGKVNQVYSMPLGADMGRGPYTWSIVGGELPPGLTLNAAPAALGGKPTAVFNGDIILQVKDTLGGVASRTFTLTVN